MPGVCAKGDGGVRAGTGQGTHGIPDWDRGSGGAEGPVGPSFNPRGSGNKGALFLGLLEVGGRTRQPTNSV